MSGDLDFSWNAGAAFVGGAIFSFFAKYSGISKRMEQLENTLRLHEQRSLDQQRQITDLTEENRAQAKVMAEQDRRLTKARSVVGAQARLIRKQREEMKELQRARDTWENRATSLKNELDGIRNDMKGFQTLSTPPPSSED